MGISVGGHHWKKRDALDGDWEITCVWIDRRTRCRSWKILFGSSSRASARLTVEPFGENWGFCKYFCLSVTTRFPTSPFISNSYCFRNYIYKRERETGSPLQAETHLILGMNGIAKLMTYFHCTRPVRPQNRTALVAERNPVFYLLSFRSIYSRCPVAISSSPLDWFSFVFLISMSVVFREV